MVDNIKSINILKKILNHLDDGRKLKLIQYNKNLQNKISINLKNYRLFSGKYIIYGENGTFKEYNSYYNALLYEGGYLNGKRNGLGKEYD